jgi:hypothetical protein
MLLGIGALTLLASNGWFGYQWQQMRRQMVDVRHQAGLLDPGRSEQLGGTPLANDEPLAWRHRVQLPELGIVRVALAWPAGQASPTWRIEQPLAAGEWLITNRILVDPRDQRWKLCLSLSGEGRSIRLYAPLDEAEVALFRKHHSSVNGGIDGPTYLPSPGTLRLLEEHLDAGEGMTLLYGSAPPSNDQRGIYIRVQSGNAK